MSRQLSFNLVIQVHMMCNKLSSLRVTPANDEAWYWQKYVLSTG